ncbi:MAG TPA: carbon-nitrogen hydrolase family protein [Solirubrobacteraceae bacterium]
MRVAAVQLNSTADTTANMAAADRLTRAAAADGAHLIVLPEKWTVLGREQDLRAGAQALDGPAISWARELARELHVDLIAGSIVERRADGRGADGQQLANLSVHIDPAGELRAAYRKLHMFDVEVEGRTYNESAVTEPGDEIVLSATAEGVELGMAICYDLRFAALFGALAARGARIVVLPSAFTLPTTRDHWEILLRARAIENEVFVIAANQVGAHPGGQRSGGRSMIVDPWGVVLASATDGEGWIAAELDLERQLEIRAQLPVLAHRRTDVYGSLAERRT